MRLLCLVLAWCLLPASEVAAQGAKDAPSEGVWIANPCGLRLDGDPLLIALEGSLVDWGLSRSRSPGFARPHDVLDVRALEAAETKRRFGSAARRGVIEVTLRDPLPRRTLGHTPGGAAVPSAVAAGTSLVLSGSLARAEVFDAEGCRVLTATSESGASTLAVPTAGLAPGAYVVRVVGAGGVVSRTVVVR